MIRLGYLLEDKIAIVTGAGSGIGRAIALELARQGSHVVVNDINADYAQSVSREIGAMTRRSLPICADVSDETAVQEMIDAAAEWFGRIDILVNNAGVLAKGPLTETTVEVWDRTFAINLRAVFLCSKAVYPRMLEQGGGVMINIASVAGKRGGGLHGNACYAATKGGVIALTKSIAREGGPHGIRANAIAPALIQTDMLGSMAEKQLVSVLESLPLRRRGKAQDVASAVCFLASDAASFITGEIMDVDGGLMMD